MTFGTTSFSLLAAAAQAMSENEFGVWGPEPVPWWEELLFYSVLGLVPLPFALLITWIFHRSDLNVPAFLCAALSAVSALVGFIGIRFVNMMVFQDSTPAFAISEAMGSDDEFMVILATIFLVGLLGSALFGSWLRRRRRAKFADLSSNAFK